MPHTSPEQKLDHPTGLSLGALADPQQASAQARPPAFGTLCARAALRMGLSATATASAGQKPWLKAAQLTLAAMAEGGAPVSGYIFIAQDERKAMAMLDDTLAILKNEPYTGSKSLLSNMELRRTYADGRRQRTFMASSLQNKEWESTFNFIASFYEDPMHARAHGIGHEFGHAWQSAANRPIHRAVAEGQSGPIADGIRARLTRLKDWIPDKEAANEHGALISEMIEEAVCDAIGCWAAQKTFGARALAPASRFREATSSEMASCYHTAWLLRMLEASHPKGLPDNFGLMIKAIKACFIKVAPVLTGNDEPTSNKKPRLS
jgi:hypothetical protein